MLLMCCMLCVYLAIANGIMKEIETTSVKAEFTKLEKSKSSAQKDYLIPEVYTNTNPDEEDIDEDLDTTYSDYYYETKEPNYRDNADASSSAVSDDDSSIPLHMAKDNLPMFIIEPENTYVVKSKPAIIKCRAANALQIYLNCNGVKVSPHMFTLVDPQSGVRIVEVELNVTREHIDEFFGEERFQCSCVAWAARGQIESQPAQVEIAYIRKQFAMSPKPQVAKEHSQVSFRCEAPAAAPFAKVFWLKNGVPVTAHDNLQTNADGSLLIKHVTLLDMANYTCVAENVAGKRFSDPAPLTVFVNGGWSQWSSWSECSCPGLSGTGRRRFRSCSAPRPMNGGQPCIGSAVQNIGDCKECELELYEDSDHPVEESEDDASGAWSQWSAWSACEDACVRVRQRRCVSSCSQETQRQVALCPHCDRTTINRAHDVSSWPIVLFILSMVIVICLTVLLLGIKYFKFKIIQPYVKSHTGSTTVGNIISRRLTNQPDITIHEEFQTIDAKQANKQTSAFFNHEHFYEVPHTYYMSPADLEARNDSVDGAFNAMTTSDRSNSTETSPCVVEGAGDRSCFRPPPSTTTTTRET